MRSPAQASASNISFLTHSPAVSKSSEKTNNRKEGRKEQWIKKWTCCLVFGSVQLNIQVRGRIKSESPLSIQLIIPLICTFIFGNNLLNEILRSRVSKLGFKCLQDVDLGICWNGVTRLMTGLKCVRLDGDE